ncbi:hypothetical protein Nepgr_015796 [Nepenthes gracilis]|uniref:Uncharacterized protein n=1 Tax=Nepenthes gracilis TaxID=150966 RepID=A0AAD3SLK1_NEPGR|nr:hypothetical protein Nepgr_015796 [Nepenthes gracilis]
MQNAGCWQLHDSLLKGDVELLKLWLKPSRLQIWVAANWNYPTVDSAFVCCFEMLNTVADAILNSISVLYTPSGGGQLASTPFNCPCFNSSTQQGINPHVYHQSISIKTPQNQHHAATRHNDTVPAKTSSCCTLHPVSTKHAIEGSMVYFLPAPASAENRSALITEKAVPNLATASASSHNIARPQLASRAYKSDLLGDGIGIREAISQCFPAWIKDQTAIQQRNTVDESKTTAHCNSIQQPKVFSSMKQRQLHHAHFPTPSKSATSAQSQYQHEVQQMAPAELNCSARKKAGSHVMNTARLTASKHSFNQQADQTAGSRTAASGPLHLCRNKLPPGKSIQHNTNPES